MKNNLLKHACLVSIFLIVLYVICLLWSSLLTDAEVIKLHTNLLKLALPGFKGYAAGSIIWGGVLVAIYGFMASLVIHKLHGNCCLGKTE